MSRQDIYQRIDAERQRQDEQFGGPEQDNNLLAEDWCLILARQVGLMAPPIGGAVMERTHTRRQLVRVAAVAVAALEWLERHEALLDKIRKVAGPDTRTHKEY